MKVRAMFFYPYFTTFAWSIFQIQFAEIAILSLFKNRTIIYIFFRHSDKREFLCNECGKTFKRKDKLKEHAKKIHSLQRKTSAMMIVAPASTHPPETIEVAEIAPAPPAATAAAVPVIVTSQPVATTPNVNANDKFTPRVSNFHLYFFFAKCTYILGEKLGRILLIGEVFSNRNYLFF